MLGQHILFDFDGSWPKSGKSHFLTFLKDRPNSLRIYKCGAFVLAIWKLAAMQEARKNFFRPGKNLCTSRRSTKSE